MISRRSLMATLAVTAAVLSAPIALMKSASAFEPQWREQEDLWIYIKNPDPLTRAEGRRYVAIRAFPNWQDRWRDQIREVYKRLGYPPEAAEARLVEIDQQLAETAPPWAPRASG